MEQVDVVAVVGTCAPERLRYAKRLAAMTQRVFVPAYRLALSPDPIDEAAALAPWTDQPAGAVFEFPEIASTTELIGTFARPDGATLLTGVICVADAGHLLEDLQRDDYVVRHPLPWQHSALTHYVAHAMLTVTQLEYASMIALVNWATLTPDELSTVMALVGRLSPQAELRLHREVVEPWRPGVPFAVGQERPGWVGLLNGDHAPQPGDARVSAFRYENIRPLHPGRLQRLLDERIEPGAFGTVVRSAGFCRLASRPHTVAQWDHVGQMISFEPLGRDDELGDDEELLALGQELAVIGIDLDQEGLTAALDEAALSDEELAAGPEAWARFADPFPAWSTAPDRSE